jgi:hypothetical protein
MVADFPADAFSFRVFANKRPPPWCVAQQSPAAVTGPPRRRRVIFPTSQRKLHPSESSPAVADGHAMTGRIRPRLAASRRRTSLSSPVHCLQEAS